jgi:thymidine phosphorylase
MDQPLGRMVGNALEVREALATLRGEGPKDLEELCLELGAELLLMAEEAGTREEAMEKLRERLREGSALAKFAELVARQGGDPKALEEPRLLPLSAARVEVKAPKSGYVTGLDALAIGKAAHLLGAGRAVKDEPIDHAVGIELLKKVGDRVEQGEPLALIYYNSEEKLSEAHHKVEQAFSFSPERPSPPELIRGRIQ